MFLICELYRKTADYTNIFMVSFYIKHISLEMQYANVCIQKYIYFNIINNLYYVQMIEYCKEVF